MLLVGLAGCSGSEPVPGRWYTQAQLETGRSVYQAHCAGCHQADASGTADWKRRLPDGRLPPPPLNGSAHTWHHDLATLERTIERGGVPLGGSMPAFGQVLDREQRRAAIAYIQSHWPEAIYRRWAESFGE